MDAVILSHLRRIEFLQIREVQLTPDHFVPIFADERNYPGYLVQDGKTFSIMSALNCLTFDAGTNFDEVYHVPKINGKNEGLYFSRHFFSVNKHVEGFCSSGQRIGIWKTYDRDGSLKGETDFQKYIWESTPVFNLKEITSI
jgi:hypothetical protein